VGRGVHTDDNYEVKMVKVVRTMIKRWWYVSTSPPSSISTPVPLYIFDIESSFGVGKHRH
jgi:hypothetical protein